MKRLHHFFNYAVGVILITIISAACTSDSDPNTGIIPTTDSLQLRFTDTTTLVAFIEKAEGIYSKNSIKRCHLLDARLRLPTSPQELS